MPTNLAAMMALRVEMESFKGKKAYKNNYDNEFDLRLSYWCMIYHILERTVVKYDLYYCNDNLCTFFEVFFELFLKYS